MNSICVTGADGMLGSHVVRRLLERGHSVRALVQPGRETGTLDGLNIERMEGDLLDPQSLRKFLGGADGIVHIAADTRIWPSRSPASWKINYEAVSLLAEAVLEQGRARLIHIGSANSFAPGSKDRPGTEEGPYTDFNYGLDYQDSKHAAQEYLLRMYREQGLRVRIINPGFMFGAYDSKPGAGQMILSLHRGKVPGYTSGGKSYVPARDVAAAVCNALEMGRDGECYLATGYNLSYREAFSLIARTIGVPEPKLPIPALFADIGGLLGSLTGRISGRAPKLSLPMARLSHADCYYDNSKAVRELAMPLGSLEDAVRECFEWMMEHGHGN